MSGRSCRSTSPAARSRQTTSAHSEPGKSRNRSKSRSKSQSRSLKQGIVGPTKTVITKIVKRAGELLEDSEAALKFLCDPDNKIPEDIDQNTLAAAATLTFNLKDTACKIETLDSFIYEQFQKPEMKDSPDRETYLREVNEAFVVSGADQILIELCKRIDNMHEALVNRGYKFPEYNDVENTDENVQNTNPAGDMNAMNEPNDVQILSEIPANGDGSQKSALRSSSPGPITSSAARDLSLMEYDYEDLPRTETVAHRAKIWKLEEENRRLDREAAQHLRAQHADTVRRLAQEKQDLKYRESLQAELIRAEALDRQCARRLQQMIVEREAEERAHKAPPAAEINMIEKTQTTNVTQSKISPPGALTQIVTVSKPPAETAPIAAPIKQQQHRSIINTTNHISNPIVDAYHMHPQPPVATQNIDLRHVLNAVNNIAEAQVASERNILQQTTHMVQDMEQRLGAQIHERAESIRSRATSRSHPQSSASSESSFMRRYERRDRSESETETEHSPPPRSQRSRRCNAENRSESPRRQGDGLKVDTLIRFLHKFDGSGDLELFQTLYNKFIMSNRDLSAEVKYAVLLNHITGPAQKCVSRAQDTVLAIATTFASLNKVYGKVNSKHNLLQKLQQLPFNQSNPEAMRLDAAAMSVVIQQMTDRGVPADDYMTMWTIAAKLPEDLRKSLARFSVKMGDSLTHEMVLDRISRDIETLAMEQIYTSQVNHHPLNELPTSYASVNFANANSNSSSVPPNTAQNRTSQTQNTHNSLAYIPSQHPTEYIDPITKSKLEGYYAPGPKGVHLKVIPRSFPYTKEEDTKCRASPNSEVNANRETSAPTVPENTTLQNVAHNTVADTVMACITWEAAHSKNTTETRRTIPPTPNRLKRFFVPTPSTNLSRGITADTESKVPNSVSQADLPTALLKNPLIKTWSIRSTNPVSKNCSSTTIRGIANPKTIEYFKNLIKNDYPEEPDSDKLALLLFTKFLARSQPHQVHFTHARDDYGRLTFVCLETARGQPLLALVDSGASLSLILEASARKLSLTILQETQLTVQGFNSASSSKTNIYALEFSLLVPKTPLSIMIVGSPKLPNTKFAAPIFSTEDSLYLKNSSIDMSRVLSSVHHNGQKIDMILGNDMLSWISAQSDYRKHILPSGRALEQTQLGIIVHPVPRLILWHKSQVPPLYEEYQLSINIATVLMDSSEPEDAMTKLTHQIAQFWRVENLGIENVSVSESTKKATIDLLQVFYKTVKFNKEGKPEVALPYNGNELRLADNYSVAYKRFISLVATLKKGKNLLNIYNEIIVGQEIAGFIEKVTTAMMKTKGPKYTIPHRGVVKEDSLTTKLRIVLDASSHARGELSLNDCLHAGTNMIIPIYGILLRMRCPRYILVGDIEKAFHQVPLQEEFRNVTMFIWLKDPSRPADDDNIQLYRFKVIPFGVSSSPFLLAAYIVFNLDNNPHDLNNEIKENLYVDNCLFCTNDKSEIASKIKGTKLIFQKMGMNLREYIVNDPDTMQSLPPAERAQSSVIKLLGYRWDSVNDTITIKIAKPDIDHPTKREVASKLAETFDPLGLVTPLMVPFKRLMQKVWLKSDTNWKDKIPKELLSDWRALCNIFIDREIVVPRQLTTNYENSELHLLLFSDASQDIYGACCYAYFAVNGKPPSVTLFTSKNKIRPSKNENWTIPKLELLGIQCASNLACAVVAELKVKVTSIKLFSDSACAIYWILSEKNTRLWVANRIKTLQDNRNRMKECGIETTIHHCPTKENPADLATRGMSTTELQNSKLWFEGPSFLKEDQSEWPCMIEGKVTCPAEFQELVYAEIIDPVTKKKKKPLMEKKTAPAEKVPEEIDPAETVMAANATISRPGSFIPYTATNSLPKLCKIVVQILKTFSKTLKSKSWDSYVMKQFHSSDCPLHQLKVARLLIISEHYKDCEFQGYTFPPDIEYHTDTDGLRRVHRRIESPVLPQEASEPILIHPRHPLAKLVALETHEINGHMPETYTASAVKTRYWIPKLGSILNNIIRECVQCQKVNNFPFAYPYTKTLPRCRTTPSKPFSKVGLDYLGPIVYKKDDNRKTGKAYVLVYTCLTTRGVVLRVVPDGTSQMYILTLKMIFHEYGVPKTIFSDNASTFKLSGSMINRDIREATYSHSLVEFLAAEVIDFKFITPLAPWQGGIYERVVKLVKIQLTKECGTRTYDYFSIQYIVSSAQSMVNNRPLIPHSRSPKDMIALRPIDFIAPGVMLEVPAGEVNSGAPPQSTEATVRAHLNKLEQAVDRLWEIWSTGYLLHLRENVHKKKRSSLLRPAVGQMVIIVTKLIKRHKWPLGVIVHVEKSQRDGQIRSAIVKCRGKLYSRAVCQLIPLELNPLNRPNIAAEDETDNAQDDSPHELPAPAVLKNPDVTYAPELFPSKDLPNIAEAENPIQNSDPKNSNQNIPLNLNIDEIENLDDTDFELNQSRLVDGGIYTDPQTVIPPDVTDEDIAELPTGRVREFLSRKAKSKPINYVHVAEVQSPAVTSPPGSVAKDPPLGTPLLGYQSQSDGPL
ncbi:hypothetical protein CRE_17412 [Caenorhabditis remanei]|uniref:Integrase catalytic domain-containing protein n=1 Tax=Caenorhabditis remanei TaxID=31234 RepID=E3N286_CAERE|nr:hypothetical protein CRE_17412 [Caenorhabditis remanei]